MSHLLVVTAGMGTPSSSRLLGDRLAAATVAALGDDLRVEVLELRDLAGGLDNEGTLSLAEDKQVREWWLSVNDALDERQRQMVAQFIAGQMARVMDAAVPRGESRGAPPGEHGARKGGGKGGMGVSMGAGGAGMNVPGN